MFFEFKVVVRSPSLSTIQLSDYQKFLISKIETLRSEGWNDPQVSRYFNENGYMTVRGKTFRPNNVWSVIKKYQNRMERINRVFENEFRDFRLTVERR